VDGPTNTHAELYLARQRLEVMKGSNARKRRSIATVRGYAEEGHLAREFAERLAQADEELEREEEKVLELQRWIFVLEERLRRAEG
jgi:hypothetical protein